MEEDKYYKDIQKAIEELPGDFSILEEQIDIGDQMKYFEFSKEIREKDIGKECFENREELFLSETPDERKKEILSAIAAVDEVKAYRTIEKYLEKPDKELRNWAVLALQESRMLLKSSLLDEKQVFISTGLGGKGKKLRYYVVFINRERNSMLNPTQQKLVKDELIFALKDNEGEFESIDFFEGFSTSLILLPLKTDIKHLFNNVVAECNQYGNFLNDDMVITNVKVLSRGEIIQMLNQGKSSDTENGLEEENY
ncbi:MAG: hypothetical protein ACQETJ_07530 [Bacteroidota bacterium]